MNRKNLIVLSVLAIVGPMLATPARAVEVPLFSDVLTFERCLNLIPAVPLIGGTGTFSGPNACALPLPTLCLLGSDPDVPDELSEVADTCTVNNLYGTYTNIVCGTGTATGSVLPATRLGERYVIKWQAAFVAGEGVVTGNSQPEPDDAGDTWVGTVSLVPTSPLIPFCPIAQVYADFDLAATET